MPTHRWWLRGALVGALLMLVALGPPVGLGVHLAWAGTTTGTAVQVAGLDNLSKTVDTYAKGNMGKVVGIGLGLAGMALFASGNAGIGSMVAMAGIGAAFVPNIISTAFDATQAAPLLPALPVAAGPAAWWQPVLGLLYPALLALRLVLDPVVVAALALSRLVLRRGTALAQG